MRPLTEREAIRTYLAIYAEMAPVERRCRRIEAVVILTNALGVIAFVAVAALGGFSILDLLSYLAAVSLALAARARIMYAAERRRQWAMMELGRIHALARLAYLDGLRDSRDRERMTA